MKIRLKKEGDPPSKKMDSTATKGVVKVEPPALKKITQAEIDEMEKMYPSRIYSYKRIERTKDGGTLWTDMRDGSILKKLPASGEDIINFVNKKKERS